jgi:hypothetical protein
VRGDDLVHPDATVGAPRRGNFVGRIRLGKKKLIAECFSIFALAFLQCSKAMKM